MHRLGWLMHRLGWFCDVLVWDGRMDFSSFWMIHGMSQIVNPCIYNLSVSPVCSLVCSNVRSHGFVVLLFQPVLPFPSHPLSPPWAPQAVAVIPAKWGSPGSPGSLRAQKWFQSNCKYLTQVPFGNSFPICVNTYLWLYAWIPAVLCHHSLLTAFSLPQLKSALVFPTWLPLPISLCLIRPPLWLGLTNSSLHV